MINDMIPSRPNTIRLRALDSALGSEWLFIQVDEDQFVIEDLVEGSVLSVEPKADEWLLSGDETDALVELKNSFATVLDYLEWLERRLARFENHLDNVEGAA